MKDLTVGKPGKVIISFAAPLFVGSIFQLLYSLIDTRIVGETLGAQALASVGATSTMNSLVLGFLIGLTNGFAVLTARDFGAQREVEVRKDVAGALILGGSMSIVLTILTVGALPFILRILRVPEVLMAEGTSYLRVILCGMIVAMLYNVCASTLRAVGDTFTPLLFLIASAICNIGLDYLFIVGCKWGVAGAAYATVLSQLGAAVGCLLYIRKRYPILRLHAADFKVTKSHLQRLLSSGLSMGLMQSLVALGTFALQGSINTFGTATIVAHTGARKITEMFMLPFSTLGMTMATYCGQNRGAGKIERIKEGIWTALKGAWIWWVVVMIASYTIAPFLVTLVTASKEVEVVQTATLYLRVDTLFYAVAATISILRNALQGIGDPITPIISSCLELVGKVAVVLFLAPKLGYLGIIWTEPIVWIIMVIPLSVQILRMPILKGIGKTISE